MQIFWMLPSHWDRVMQVSTPPFADVQQSISKRGNIQTRKKKHLKEWLYMCLHLFNAKFSIQFQGFETRGTVISRRLISWENLLESVSHVGPLTTNPLEAKGMISRVKVDPQEIIEKKLERKRQRNKNKRRRKNNSNSNINRQLLSSFNSNVCS